MFSQSCVYMLLIGMFPKDVVYRTRTYSTSTFRKQDCGALPVMFYTITLLRYIPRRPVGCSRIDLL